MIDREKEMEWRKEYLQEMESILENAAIKYDLERVREQLSPEEFGDEDLTEDEYSLSLFFCNKMIPLMEVVVFVTMNDPFDPEQAVSNEGEYPRYTATEMFNFISGMTNYGKYRIANHFPGNDDAYLTLLDAILTNDEQLFLETVDKEQVDFSEFRRGIREVMFLTQKYYKLLQKIAAPFQDPKSGEVGMDMKGITDFEQFLIEHMPQSRREAFEGYKKIRDEIDELPEDEIDEEIVQKISRLHFPKNKWSDYLQSVLSFETYVSLVNGYTDAEIAIVNSFLDDPKTNFILGAIERTAYILSNKGCNLRKLFVPKSIRNEIDNGELDDLICELHGPGKEIGQDNQKPNAVPTPNPLPGGDDVGGNLEELKPYQFEWPSWEDFKERTSVGIPPSFEFLTELVDRVEDDFKTPEGYEHFKDFMNLVAKYGSIKSDTVMKALLQFVTKKAFEGAAKKIKWNADNYLGRVLYFVVQWISVDDEKLGKTARMTEFCYSNPDMPDKGLDMDRIYTTLQRAKGISTEILNKLHDCYDFIPNTKAAASKRKP